MPPKFRLKNSGSGTRDKQSIHKLICLRSFLNSSATMMFCSSRKFKSSYYELGFFSGLAQEVYLNYLREVIQYWVFITEFLNTLTARGQNFRTSCHFEFIRWISKTPFHHAGATTICSSSTNVSKYLSEPSTILPITKIQETMSRSRAIYLSKINTLCVSFDIQGAKHVLNSTVETSACLR